MKTDSTDTAQPVPPLNLAANFTSLRDELLREVSDVCTSGAYVLGPKVEAFEAELADYCGAKYALGVSSGTDALLLALMALGIGRGDEVIVPTFTFFATAGVVHRLGARPVFVDIDPQTFNLDIAAVGDALTPRTRAVIPVHLYGQVAALRPLCALVGRHGVHIVEDAAQAIGAVPDDYPGRRAGAVGTFGALSFYPTKNLGAMGDAGALLTNDEKLFELARKLRIHGSGHTYHHEMVGGNFRIDALQAAVLRIKLTRLEDWNQQRRALATNYTHWIEQAGLSDRVRPPVVAPGAPDSHVYHQYVLRAERRDALLAHLRGRKIGAGVYYPIPLHLQPCFAYLGYGEGAFPAAEQAAREVLALPVYPEMTETQQRAVVDALAAFYA